MSSIIRIKNFLFRHKWKTLITLLLILPIGAIAMFALQPAQPEYITQVAERGDIQQSVEAVGTVISDRDLQLQFPLSGIVAQVYVKEGDTVKVGQRLTALRAGNLSADIASASARVQQVEADLRAKQEGARPEDIAVSEAEVASRRASLETARTVFKTSEEQLKVSYEKLVLLKKEAANSLVGDVAAVGSTISRELTVAQNAMSKVKDVYGRNDVADAINKYGSSEFSSMSPVFRNAETALTIALGSTNSQDYQQALAALDQAKIAMNLAIDSVNRMFTILSTIGETSYFTNSSRETYKAEIVTQRNNVQTSLGGIDAESKSLRDASATYSTRISAEESTVVTAKGSMDRAESDITSYEAALSIAEAQLQLKKAPTRQSDIDYALANVRQARATLARAVADYNNTVLTAPIAGKITKVAVKIGEITPVGMAVSMLGNSPYRIEMYVSEIDVPKVQLSQSGSIELDAFRGTDFQLRVTEMDTASTDRDGVPKYRVRLDFVYPHDELKIGMTGDAAIITGVQKDVVSVPQRALLERDDGTNYVRVQKEDGTIEEREVEIGLEGEGGDVEVTGIEEGEIVIELEKK